MMLTVPEYAKKLGVSKVNVLVKLRKGWFKPEEYVFFDKLKRYMIHENAEWPMHVGGRKKQKKEKK